MATRESLLDVTARLFAEHGWRGTTTRRIAEAAGVNEVTLFRQFGSKEHLLLEAIEHAASEGAFRLLPAQPGDLRAELIEWGLAHHQTIREKSGIIRSCLAEWEERPALAPQACEGGRAASADLVRYLEVARQDGGVGGAGSIAAAATMYVNAIFMDAVTRDIMPGAHPGTPEATISAFVDVMLRGLGAEEVE